MDASTNTEAPQRQSLEGLRAAPAVRVAEANLPVIAPGFGSLQGYELMIRQAKALSSSTLVPPQYRQIIQKVDRDGNPKGPAIENANAIPNCMIALNMATRMNADPLMVMQNLVVVEGRPSWSSQWVIAQINNCGRFEPMRFDLREVGLEKVEIEYTEWNDGPGGRRTPTRKVKVIEVDNIECRAWTVQKGVKIPPGVNTIEQAVGMNLPILKGPKVSVAMAAREGWYDKNGSKWKTMPELMLHYRSGSFFGRLYAPELLMGIPSEDEVRDMGTLVQANDGSYTPTPAASSGEDPLAPSLESLRRTAAAHADTGEAEDTLPKGPAVDPKPEAANAQNASNGSAIPGGQDKPAAQTASPTEARDRTVATGAGDGATLFGNTD